MITRVRFKATKHLELTISEFSCHRRSSILKYLAGRQRAGLDAPTLARKLNIREDKLIPWEKGDILPTFKQAQNYAHNTYIPFGYLFLKHPPRDDLPIPDLRTVGDHGSKGISINLRDIIQEVIRHQLWYQEYLTEIDAKPIEVVGSFSVNAPVKAIVIDMKIKPLA